MMSPAMIRRRPGRGRPNARPAVPTSSPKRIPTAARNEQGDPRGVSKLPSMDLQDFWGRFYNKKVQQLTSLNQPLMEERR